METKTIPGVPLTEGNDTSAHGTFSATPVSPMPVSTPPFSAKVIDPLATSAGSALLKELSPEEKILSLLESQGKKIDDLTLTLTKMKRRSTIGMWLTIIFVVLPVVASVFFLPALMSSYLGTVGVGAEGGSSPQTAELLKQVESLMQARQEAASVPAE